MEALLGHHPAAGGAADDLDAGQVSAQGRHQGGLGAMFCGVEDEKLRRAAQLAVQVAGGLEGGLLGAVGETEGGGDLHDALPKLRSIKGRPGVFAIRTTRRREN